MPVKLSNRMSGLVQSDIRAMTREATRVGALNLGQGICELPTPDLVQQGAIQAIHEHKSTYTPPEGIEPLREKIAEKVQKENRFTVNPQTEVVVTCGTAGGYTNALMALLNPGDGILLFEPFYGYHLNGALLLDIEAHFCELKAPEFEVTYEILNRSIQPNTKAIVVCTPANPSGKIWTEREISALAKVANEKDLLVITDEIYEFFRYDDIPHLSPAAREDLFDRTVTLMGLSKTFNVTGWRLGYALAPADLAKALMVINDIFYICAPTPLQYGGMAGFEMPTEQLLAVRQEFQNKRDRFCRSLEKAKFTPIIPSGAYYVLADISRIGAKDSKEAAMALLERVKIASIPGRAFYQSATQDSEKYVRFCFGVNDAVLDEACRRLESF